MKPFFILSSARAGSTSLARILDRAVNGCCATEPTPNLNVETRLAMEGRLDDLDSVVDRVLLPRVAGSESRVYGEKNVTYGPFIPSIHRKLDARFILLARDGRDVARSLMDWHNLMFGTVYREAPEAGELSETARKTAGALPVHLDTSDFARPRPGPDDPLRDKWFDLSRFEMCSYYWARIYDLYLDKLDCIPADTWTKIDYTTATAEDVLAAAAFVGLAGLDAETVADMLSARINSVQDRSGERDRFPAWVSWDGGQRRRFEQVAGGTMQRLGYWKDWATRWKPPSYGHYWLERAADLAWFEWMYEGRRSMHEEAIAWIRSNARGGSIMDFGCGVGVGYSDALADQPYIGVDIAGPSIEWAGRNRCNPRHRYEARDFIAQPFENEADVVMSSGTIDNAYDPEAYLDAMIRASRKYIYLTCYRGWFPELEEHRFMWSPEHGCFYADLSAPRLREHLELRGCTDITVEPRRTGRSDIPWETRVIARVPAKEAA